MKPLCFAALRKMCAVALLAASSLAACGADSIGVGLLRGLDPALNGGGVPVAQVEAPASTNNPPPYQVDPSQVGQPVSRFTYYASSGSSGVFPNSLGAASGHAGSVASIFYGLPNGVSTNVTHIYNYEATHFILDVVSALVPMPLRIANQTFIIPGTPEEQEDFDLIYDHYADQFNTLFLSGVGNGGGVNAPATSYNGIGVGAFGGGSSIGPTADNGRAKPDIVAPAEVTSYSTPQVSGAATILLQAAIRGDGGANTNAAADARTLKALLMNGAIKPTNWANPSPSPLDPRFGAGVLNVFNSYNQLLGGKHGYIESGLVPAGNPHLPGSATGNVAARSGWDFNTASGTGGSDGVNHYYFEIGGTGALSNAPFTATATLVWNRQAGETEINNLELYLYEVLSGNLVAASTSVVDNVEHLWIPELPPGRYDLQVLKRAGGGVSLDETYALAFEFFSMPLTISRGTVDGEGVVRWPDYPAGFVLESSPTLGTPTWNAVSAAPTVTNRMNRVELDAVLATEFFRLNRLGIYE